MPNEAAISAPGMPAGVTVIESSTPAPAPTVTPTDTSAMGERQALTMKWIDEVAKPAILRGGDSNPSLLANYRAALAHVFHGGPEPEHMAAANGEPKTAEQIAAGELPHDPMSKVFEAAAKPASGEQIKAAVDNAVVQGVRRELAQEAAGICGDLQLSEGHTRAILDRVRAHHGAKIDSGPESSFAVLSEAEVSEYATEASRILGSTEKLQELSLRSREFLAARGVLEKFDKSRLTESSLAFDPKLLHTLAMAADMAGIPRGKR